MSARLQILKTKFVDSNEKTVSAVINYMKNYICVRTDFYSEIIVLLKLYLVSPATNAVSEPSASLMRRIRNWMISTMLQEKLNYCMLLSIHKEKADKINLKKWHQFICWSEWREKMFLWYLLWYRRFTVKRLKSRYFQKSNLLTLMDNFFLNPKKTHIYFVNSFFKKSFKVYFCFQEIFETIKIYHALCAVLGACCENLLECPFFWYFAPYLKTTSADPVQYIMLMWKWRYWKIFRSALLYLKQHQAEIGKKFSKS